MPDNFDMRWRNVICPPCNCDRDRDRDRRDDRRNDRRDDRRDDRWDDRRDRYDNWPWR